MNDDLISRQTAIDALIAEGRNVDSRYLESERVIHESDAVEAISLLSPAQQWIPVSERLPEKHRPMIVTDFGHVTLAYTNNLGEWMDYDGNRLKNVTAWMSLPEPYRKETDMYYPQVDGITPTVIRKETEDAETVH